MTDLITQERLKELLHYDPDTGVFTWLSVKPRSKVKIGDRAGCITRPTGYRLIKVDGRPYGAGRLAHLYMVGRWPIEIDHINRVRHDDRWSNLREVDSSAQNHNRRPLKSNTSGFPGVRKHARCNRWLAQIRVNRKSRYLGLYKTPQEASEAYQRAKAELSP